MAVSALNVISHTRLVLTDAVLQLHPLVHRPAQACCSITANQHSPTTTKWSTTATEQYNRKADHSSGHKAQIRGTGVDPSAKGREDDVIPGSTTQRTLPALQDSCRTSRCHSSGSKLTCQGYILHCSSINSPTPRTKAWLPIHSRQSSGRSSRSRLPARNNKTCANKTPLSARAETVGRAAEGQPE